MLLYVEIRRPFTKMLLTGICEKYKDKKFARKSWNEPSYIYVDSECGDFVTNYGDTFYFNVDDIMADDWYVYEHTTLNIVESVILITVLEALPKGTRKRITGVRWTKEGLQFCESESLTIDILHTIDVCHLGNIAFTSLSINEYYSLKSLYNPYGCCLFEYIKEN